MKKTLKAVLSLSTTLLLSSCNSVVWSGVRIGCVSNLEDGHINAQYSKFDGSAIYTIEVKEKHALSITCDIKTTSGELNYSICKVGEDSLYATSVTSDNLYVCELPEYGKYKITVNANSHSGSYEFTWIK